LPIVYDLRAGAGEQQYAARSGLYRWVFRSCLRAAAEVLVEGEALLPFVARLARRAPVYLPNHVDTDALPWRDTTLALPAAPTVAYVGRIVEEKGVVGALDAVRLLRSRGLDAKLRLAGDGEARYLQRLSAASAALDVRWLGPMSSQAVLALLREAHVFVFATRHVGEGQSNALTEAMACGCVPIASRHGFNEAVIGEAALILPSDAPAAAYADAVERLWPAHWPALSLGMQRRARERFSSAAALRTLLGTYRRAVRPALASGEAGFASPPKP
jgi:glycosyltransferase involved in cell wall biosynthesis